jgi:alginate O-acetyltransferase complex protein AlgI
VEFNSLEYVVLLGVTLVLYHGIARRRQWRTRLLLAASLWFYASWNAPFLLVLLASVAIDWKASKAIAAASRRARKRAWLSASLAANLGCLGFFKYSGFALENLRLIEGLPPLPSALDVVLPIGISFYTFQSMSYTIDVYRGEIEPEPRFHRLLLYVAFFPQLIAGPIERAKRLLGQVQSVETLPMPGSAWSTGVTLVVWGLFQKCVLADNSALVCDTLFGETEQWPGGWQAVATYAFALQIFFDFSGYCDIARGSARLLGFDLMRNFQLPYLAEDPSGFWRRWHISLSEWFRDYVYIPLGGGRGTPLRVFRNLLITMLLAGLWHGAGWTFVLWGAWHGLLLVAYRGWEQVVGRRRLSGRIWRFVRVSVLFHLVCVGWILFRASSIGEASQVLGAIGRAARDAILQPTAPAWTFAAITAAAITAVIAAMALEEHRQVFSATLKRPGAYAVVVAAMVIAIAVLTPETGPTFIYFQF